MAFNPLAGKSGNVAVGGTSYAFGKWTATIKNQLGKVTNFTGGGFAQFVAGITDAKVTVEGPYDEGNMPFTCGSSYTLILTYTAAINLTATCLLESIEPDVDVEKEQRMKLTFQSNGSFTAAIV